MKYVSSLLAAALAASLCAPAAAQQVSLSPSGSGMLSGSFTQAVDGLFIDTFTFAPASVGGLVSVVLSNVSGPVSFFTASLNDQNFSFFPETGATNFAFNANFATAVPLTLTVFGAVLDEVGNLGGAGSYRGTINVAAALPVPEPEVWALLLAGLGAVGFAGQRRREGDGGAPVEGR